jgi:hypothetical protein
MARFLAPPLQDLAAKIERKITGKKGNVKGAIASFEPMTSSKLEMTDYVRADLAATDAWTIHPADHSADFIAALPKLITAIEQGKYPLAQAGNYDLILSAWQELL